MDDPGLMGAMSALPVDVLREARRWAQTLGWAKTYDAEHLALAHLESDSILTVDARLAKRIGELVEVLVRADI